MSKVSHLILSSTIDYSTDFICLELARRNEEYLRLNRDRFSLYGLSYDFASQVLTVKVEGRIYTIDNDDLSSVYFRAPTFIRSHKRYNIEEQLYRSQWSSFIRNLVIFEKALWINNPVDVYRAENKALQLQLAKNNGLTIPKTIISNIAPNLADNDLYIVKALDTPLFYDEDNETFTYSSIVSGAEIKSSRLADAPIVIQECLNNKIDIRATVVGDKIYSVAITDNGDSIEGDWRKTKKDRLRYDEIVLPNDVQNNILGLMRALNLSFGGVDLIKSGGKYYFIEVNPTGEWGWLVKSALLPIDKEIVNLMVHNNA